MIPTRSVYTIIHLIFWQSFIVTLSLALVVSQLNCELRGHTGLVNCLVCSDKAILYSGDSKGKLGVWHEKQGVWQMKKTIDIVNVSTLVTIDFSS